MREASSGVPRNSPNASATRWRNSRTRRGSVSVDVGARKRSRSWRIEKRIVGGFTEGWYWTEDRGAFCER